MESELGDMSFMDLIKLARSYPIYINTEDLRRKDLLTILKRISPDLKKIYPPKPEWVFLLIILPTHSLYKNHGGHHIFSSLELVEQYMISLGHRVSMFGLLKGKVEGISMQKVMVDS